METKANYLFVGAFVLALTFGAIGFVIWLAKVQFDTQFARYDIYYDSAVTGLQVGSPVKYRGINVGEVTAIRIDPKDVARVLVTIEVAGDTPVREDTVATLSLLSLASGTVFVHLTGGTHDAAPLEAGPGQRYPVIASKPFALDKVLASVDEILVKVSDLLNDKNRQAISDTLQNVADLTGALAEKREALDTLLTDAAAAARALRAAAESIQSLTGKLDVKIGGVVDQVDSTLGAFEDVARNVDDLVTDNSDKIGGTVEDLRQMAESFRRLADEAKSMVAENREPIRDFTHVGLYELTTLLTEARELMISFKRVTTEVERDPARFLFGDQQQGYEAGVNASQ